MTHSGLTNQIRQSWQRSSRNGATIDTFLIHHQAGTNDDATIAAMVSGAKEVSANYTISNEGRLTLVVDEDYRAWTSGSSSDGGKGAAWDRRSITVEIENQSAGGDWPISRAALNTAAALLRDLRKRYGIRYVLGHRNLWEQYRASYPTYCPGPNTVASIVSIAGGGGSLPAPGNTPSIPAAGVNYAFGLTSQAQEAVQGALQRLGRYTGIVDGAFGALSVRAFQQWLKDAKYLPSTYAVDGVPGKVYGLAVQTLAKKYGYAGDMDGLPGAQTSAALVNWARTVKGAVPGTSAGGKDWSYWEPTGALAKRVQRALKARGRYSGPVDGIFGPETRKGVQTTIKNVGYTGPVDGVIGREGCYYIQAYAKKFGSYTGPLDRAPRQASWTGFALGLERP